MADAQTRDAAGTVALVVTHSKNLHGARSRSDFRLRLEPVRCSAPNARALLDLRKNRHRLGGVRRRTNELQSIADRIHWSHRVGLFPRQDRARFARPPRPARQSSKLHPRCDPCPEAWRGGGPGHAIARESKLSEFELELPASTTGDTARA